VNIPELTVSHIEERAAWLRLSLVPGVPPSAQRSLLKTIGSPSEVLSSAASRIADVAGSVIAERLAAGPDQRLVENTLRWLEVPDHHLLALGDDAYPRALLEIHDPPTVLYAIGRASLLNMPSFAIVGSRNATPLGMRDAHSFALALSDAGLCIVSGLALGIDACAHRGGLAGASSSLAVMGTGADRVYPSRNRELAHQIAARGCLVTEFPLGTGATAGNFPRRNRLISGLARGVLVVEAADESGSLITAHTATEQGRDVFAIPGSIHSPLSKGCHILIKEGAKLVDRVDDVLNELGLDPPIERSPAPVARGAPSRLLEAMGFVPMTVDRVAQLVGEGAATISAQLSQLEIEGRVQALAGGRFQRLEPGG